MVTILHTTTLNITQGIQRNFKKKQVFLIVSCCVHFFSFFFSCKWYDDDMMVVRSVRQLRYFTLIIMASPCFFFFSCIIFISLFVLWCILPFGNVAVLLAWVKHIAEYYDDDGTQKETNSSVTFNDRYQSKYA